MTLALINGKIHTLDEKDTLAEAVVIDNSTIILVGSTKEIQSTNTKFDQVIDLKGYSVLPGFIDGHAHLGHLGLESLWVDLSKTESTEEIFQLLKERIDTTQKGEWVVGVMYDDAGWRTQECITKDNLDALSTNHPIFLRRVCGHYGVVNTLALEQIGDEWKYVDRNTGILLEDAVLGFMKIIKPELSMRIEGTKKVIPVVHSLGLTAIREIVNFQSIKTYEFLDKNHQLKIRIFGYIIYDDLDEYLLNYPNGLEQSNYFKIIGVKLFLDGSLGARTAALKEPYSDEPDNNGKLLHSNTELREIFARVKALNFPMMVHAIGDRAIQQFIDIYNDVFKDQVPDNTNGHTLEHVEVIDDELLSDLKRSGVYVSAQPNFAGRWSNPGGLNEKRLGKQRLARCNAYYSFIKENIPLIFGSDSMPFDPLFGIRSAIFHQIKEQRITPNEAIKAYTKNCYKLFNLESNFGSIEQEKFADLVILTSDPFIEQDFDNIKVAGTIINGEFVYSNNQILN